MNKIGGGGRCGDLRSVEFLGCLLWKMGSSLWIGRGWDSVHWLDSCCFRAAGLRVEPQDRAEAPEWLSA